jgi:battenin
MSCLLTMSCASLKLIYQTFVFFSRSSISLGIPPLPRRLLPLPAVLQGFILASLALESAFGILPESSGGSIPWVALLIAVEGICGGLA